MRHGDEAESPVFLTERELHEFLRALPAMIALAEEKGLDADSVFETVAESLFDAVKNCRLSAKEMKPLLGDRNFLALSDEDGTLMIAHLLENGYCSIRDFPEGSKNRDLVFKRNKFGVSAQNIWMAAWKARQEAEKARRDEEEREKRQQLKRRMVFL